LVAGYFLLYFALLSKTFLCFAYLLYAIAAVLLLAQFAVAICLAQNPALQRAGDFQDRNLPSAVDTAAPFRLAQALFQCVHSLVERAHGWRAPRRRCRPPCR